MGNFLFNYFNLFRALAAAIFDADPSISSQCQPRWLL